MKPEINLLLYMKQKKKIYFLAGILQFFQGISYTALPFLIGVFLGKIGEYLQTRKNQNEVLLILFLILLSIFSNYTLDALSTYFGRKGSILTAEKIRDDVFFSLQQQSQKYYERQKTGDLVNKVTSDIQALSLFYYLCILIIPLTLSQFIFTVFFFTQIDLEITLIAVVIIPVTYFILNFLNKKYAPIVLESRNQYGKLSSIIQEYLDCAIISRVFDTKKRDYERFDKENKKYMKIRKRGFRYSKLIWHQTFMISEIFVVLVLLVGGLKVIQGTLSIGLLISSIMLVGYLQGPVGNSSTLSEYYSEFKASSTRIISVLETIPDISNSSNPVDLSEPKGFIEFKNINFSYKTEPVLRNISLKIPTNTKLAILGRTGSGKSSLINLIPRFYDVSDGQVLIDGIDVRNLNLESLRKSIGFIDQETFLFSRSIKENIAFGRPDAPFHEIKQAAINSRIHSFITSLPEGYDTFVGERGVNLSGGQKQRLSIARTLLINPKIIIFDDSLSAVDLKTEYKILEILESILKDRTVIFVTQRLSIVKSMDYIILMDEGEILEQGTHQELFNKNGYYTKLCETQVNDMLDLSLLEELTEGDFH
ncbi:MAG: ABC transporter ATP-binding protein [Candidatus Thorarchaeota archaeon]